MGVEYHCCPTGRDLAAEDSGEVVIPSLYLEAMSPGDFTLLLARERETRVHMAEGDAVARARLKDWLYLEVIE